MLPGAFLEETRAAARAFAAGQGTRAELSDAADRIAALVLDEPDALLAIKYLVAVLFTTIRCESAWRRSLMSAN
jgi:hypothetical protein